MNKKQLIIAAMAAMLSVSSAGATSYITGVTNGNTTPGTFNIDPMKVNGNVGYSHYDRFEVGSGDVANLNFHSDQKGGRDIETFINLVNNQINVNGVLNTVRNGNFYNGHAVFISPKGMVVGASGVLNIGTLSVLTPTQAKFKGLTDDYADDEFDVINNINAMRNSTYARDNNHGGNALVDVQGYIIARNGVDIRGSQVDVSGGIVNGYAGTNKFSDFTTAKNLFNQLVNTDGVLTTNASYLANNNSTIVIKSGVDPSTTNKAGITVSGRIGNLNKTEMAITNHGSQGLEVRANGRITSNGDLNVYNNANVNTADLSVSGKLKAANRLSVTNKGRDLVLETTANLTAKDVELVNNVESTGKINIKGGTIVSNANGKVDVVNDGAGGITVTAGTVGDTNTKTVRIVNQKGKLTFAATAKANDSISVRNHGTGGMDFTGNAEATKGVLLQNFAGNMNLNGADVKVETGNIHVANSLEEGQSSRTGSLTMTGTTLETDIGKIAVRNDASGGMSLAGAIKGNGDIAINNYGGAATVNVDITNTGNTAILNRTGSGLTVGGTITNEGNVNIKNESGANGLTVNATVENEDGNITVYNEAGRATINGKLHNANGNTYVFSQRQSTGLTTSTASEIFNEGGDLAIKHNGAGKNASGNGMDLNGKVKNDRDIAINNYTGDMHVGGVVTEVGNGTIGIINRAQSQDKFHTSKGGAAMTVDATVSGGDINIKNNGSGNMAVRGNITHDGRLNILANDGQLTLGGKITNNGSEMTYATARTDSALGISGDGITVENTFNATTTNDGTILIKNISGANGLNYKGTMTAAEGSDAQIEIYNKVGDMTVSGTMQGGRPAVILNTGNGLTVTDAANLQADVKIVNKGSQAATVADKYKGNLRQKLK